MHAAYAILLNALEEPFLQITANAGKKSGEISAKVRERIIVEPKGNPGYDALNDKIVADMVKEGIVDPVKVTRSALQNAASAAAMFLTTEAVITDLPEEKSAGGGGMPSGMGGMGDY